MKYDAFISYSHSADGDLGPALQRELHRFAKPWYRRRALRVFRDQASLSASPGLWPSIAEALDEAEYFILLASPAAAESEWVNREVEYWLEHRGTDTILIALTEGHADWDGPAGDFSEDARSAIPRALHGAFEAEPRLVDMRWTETQEEVGPKDPRFLDAVADLAAPLHGRSKDEMVGEDLRQHRRTRRVTASAVVLLTALTLAASGLAVLFFEQRADAIAARNRNFELNGTNEELLGQNQQLNDENASLETSTRSLEGEQQRLTDDIREAEASLEQALVLVDIEEARAASLRMAGQANGLVETQLDLALLLGIEAIEQAGRARELQQAANLEVEVGSNAEALGLLLDGIQLRPNLLTHIHGGFEHAAFSRDGELVALGGPGTGLFVSDAGFVEGAAEESPVMLGEPRSLGVLEFGAAPLLASVLGSQVEIWDIDAQRQLSSITVDDSVRSISFHPTEPILAVGADASGVVSFWGIEDPSTPRLLLETPVTERCGTRCSLFSIDFSPRGDALAWGGFDQPGTLDPRGKAGILWLEVQTSETVGLTVVGETLLDREEIQAGFGALEVEFQPTCAGASTCMLAIAFNDDTVRWWNVDGRSATRVSCSGGPPLSCPPLSGAESIAWSSDGTFAAGGRRNGTVNIWRVNGTSVTGPDNLGRHPSAVVSVAFSEERPDILLSFARAGGTDLGESGSTGLAWDLIEPVAVGRVREVASNYVPGMEAVTFTADGRLFTGGRDGAVRAWALAPELEEATAFVPDQTLLSCQASHPSAVADLAATNLGGTTLLAASTGSEAEPGRGCVAGRGQVLLWDLGAEPILVAGLLEAAPRALQLEGTADWIDSVAFDQARCAGGPRCLLAAGTRFIVDGGFEYRTLIWDVANPNSPIALPSLSGHVGQVRDVEFSPTLAFPERTLLATASTDGSAKLWDFGPTGAGVEIATLHGHRNRLTAVSFHPVRPVLATAGFDQTVRMWDIEDPANPQLIGAPLLAHQLLVSSIAWSPAGQMLAASSSDGTVSVWDTSSLANPTAIGTPLTHSNAVFDVSISPDGRTLASVSDGVAVWPFGLEAWREVACRLANRELTGEEWRRFVGEQSPPATICE